MKILNDKIRSVKQFTEDAVQSVGQFITKTVGVATKKFNEIGQVFREKTVDITAKVRLNPNITNDKTSRASTLILRVKVAIRRSLLQNIPLCRRELRFPTIWTYLKYKVRQSTRQPLHEVVYETREKVQLFFNPVKEKLANFNLKNTEWVVRSLVVGHLTSVGPLLLKHLPTVAKSLSNRSGGVTPDKLFDIIPMGVKLSEESILKFLKKHEVSHRISIKNNPTKASNPNNITFEHPLINRARGPKNMTRTEFKNAQLKNRNIGRVGAGKAVLGTVTRGALLAALLELPITCIENALHVKNNRKSDKEGIIDAVRDVRNNALGGGIVAGALTGLSLLGITLGPATIPLAVVGGTLYTWSATDRIWKALDGNTKEKILNYKPMLFLASVTKCQKGKNCVSWLEMLTESEITQSEH